MGEPERMHKMTSTILAILFALPIAAQQNVPPLDGESSSE
jgi:hypothetical protein